jgi:hypothetical protein
VIPLHVLLLWVLGGRWGFDHARPLQSHRSTDSLLVGVLMPSPTRCNRGAGQGDAARGEACRRPPTIPPRLARSALSVTPPPGAGSWPGSLPRERQGLPGRSRLVIPHNLRQSVASGGARQGPRTDKSFPPKGRSPCALTSSPCSALEAPHTTCDFCVPFPASRLIQLGPAPRTVPPP